MTRPSTTSRPGLAAAVLALILAGCAGRQDPGQAEVEIRGSDPSGTARAGTSGTGGPAGPAITGEGIVAYDGYAAARAREGDTVATLADRVGLSASELGAYNGLSATHPLRAGDELVLPPRPGGYVPSSAPAPISAAPATSPSDAGPGTGGIEAQPLDLSGAADPGTRVAAAPAGTAVPGAAPGAAPGTAPVPGDSGWSPELVLGAIDRSGDEPATETPGQGVDVPAPPSAGAPLPPEPKPVEPLASPQLSQYQRTTAPETRVATAGDPSADLPVASDSDPATSDPGPAAPSATPRLQRPVDGPVALGFREGAGGVKNDGVDFSAPAGAPVVAAEAGEVALVSEALGGLGTIVLLRHPGELLTVYGRISGVTVKKGDLVSRGQQIGVVASPEGGVAPRMHFEVRQGAASVDPMRFI